MGLTEPNAKAHSQNPHISPLPKNRPSHPDLATPQQASNLAKTLRRSTMLIRRPLQTLTLPLLRRHFSAATVEAFVSPDQATDPLSPPYDYLPGHPRPDAKHNEVILAVPRASSGRHVAAKERKAGRVPAIVFEQENGQEGGNKRLISVRANQIRKLVDHLGRSFFLSRLFSLQVWSEHAGQGELIESVRVLPRKVCDFSVGFNCFFHNRFIVIANVYLSAMMA
jgi:large subunit ribosomal protein L25